MKWSDRLWRWLFATPEQDTIYDFIDQELSRNERFRLDTADGVGSRTDRAVVDICWQASPVGFVCMLDAGHLGDHLAESGDHTILDVWGPRNLEERR